jgi:uncharacterized protein YihD (DUF1040 family)
LEAAEEVEAVMTRDPNRIYRVLQALRAYWSANPDLRLCQIVGNFANDTARAGDMRNEHQPEVSSRVYNTEDDKVLAYLEAQIKEPPVQSRSKQP